MSTATSSTARVRSKSPANTLQLETLLQINVATLVVLSTLLLANGQQDPLYALLSLGVAVIAVIVTDIKGYFRLSPAAANAAAIGVCVILVLQIIQNRGESQLLNVANTLIFLEIILLLQKKEERTYWSLLALSLLQVIVAAALNLGILFSLLLGFYLLAGISALTLFFVYRETRPFMHGSTAIPQRGNSPSKSEKNHPSSTAATSDLPRRILNRSYLHRLVRLVVITGLTTILAFFAIPRFSNSVWESPQQAQAAMTGFTEEVSLEDLGRILESPEQVMRVEFTTLQGVPYDVVGEPYFRGTVLSDYRGDGAWRQFRSESANRPLQSQGSFDLAQAVLQKYTLQPRSHSILFHVAPCYPVGDAGEGLKLNTHTRQLRVAGDDERIRNVYRYALYTTAFRNGWQKDLLPVMRDFNDMAGDPTRIQLYDAEYWQTNFPSITAISDNVIASQRLTSAPLLDKIKALEGHFRTSGLYRYSLEGEQTRNRQLDPIEDFVRNHRTGHCEYFASALTLMLRSQQIPARMVVGYKGGDFNTVGNYYIVRQLHAHAWVEAYLPANEIPSGDLDPLEDRALGAWLRLDPTPTGQDIVANRSRLPLVTKMRELVDYCQVLWDDYVLGLNATRQRQAIYGPLWRSIRTMVRAVTDRSAWQSRFQNLQLSAWHFVAIPASVLLLFLLRKPLVRLGSALAAVGRRRIRPDERAYPRVDFYERMLQILAKRGLKRQPHETPLEFANAAGGRLAEIAPAVHVAGIPRNVTDAFYRVRFGGESLALEEQSQLKGALNALDQALRQRG